MNFDFSIGEILKYGALPKAVNEPEHAVDFLEAYVSNYLEQEIQQETFIRNLGSFVRFLEVAVLSNAQVVNLSNVARDAGIARSTVERYFEVLESTLIGNWLPAWKPRAKIKETAHPKFYLFDPGVVRAIQDRLREPLDRLEQGPLMETLVFHELKAYRNASNCGGKFFYWRTPAGQEVDFIWQRGKRNVGIEVKTAQEWKRGFGTVLKKLHAEGVLTDTWGVYMGQAVLKDGPLTVLPLVDFMKRLNGEGIIG